MSNWPDNTVLRLSKMDSLQQGNQYTDATAVWALHPPHTHEANSPTWMGMDDKKAEDGLHSGRHDKVKATRNNLINEQQNHQRDIAAKRITLIQIEGPGEYTNGD